MLIYWIWLATRRGLSDHKKYKLLERYHTPERIFRMTEDERKAFPEMTQKGAESLRDLDLRTSEKILRQCAEKKIGILTIQDAAYPSQLKNIYDPPVVLYYKGSIPVLDSAPVIGVVGTRKASTYGLNTANRLGCQLAECGAVVVSGAASGIDAMAMQGALSAGGCVIGVLGCGADRVYPSENRALYADTERYGCLLSEFPPGTAPLGSNFPRRNRIISGLSHGVLVVEAPEKSGALITARQAMDQGRDVFTVPGNIDNPAGKGSNGLLKDGAIPVESGQDVVDEYAALFPGRMSAGRARILSWTGPEKEKTVRKVAQKPKKPASAEPKMVSAPKKGIDNGASGPYIDLNKIKSSLTSDEAAIVDQIAGGQKLVDDIIADSGFPAGQVLASLTLLEVKGIVRRLPGRMIALTEGK